MSKITKIPPKVQQAWIGAVARNTGNNGVPYLLLETLGGDCKARPYEKKIFDNPYEY